MLILPILKGMAEVLKLAVQDEIKFDKLQKAKEKEQERTL